MRLAGLRGLRWLHWGLDRSEAITAAAGHIAEVPLEWAGPAAVPRVHLGFSWMRPLRANK